MCGSSFRIRVAGRTDLFLMWNNVFRYYPNFNIAFKLLKNTLQNLAMHVKKTADSDDITGNQNDSLTSKLLIIQYMG